MRSRGGVGRKFRTGRWTIQGGGKLKMLAIDNE